jgi:hypothetical protein
MSPVYILHRSMDNSLCHDHQMIKKLLDAYSTLKNLWVDSEQVDLSLKLYLIHPHMGWQNSQTPSTIYPVIKITVSSMNTIKVE